MPALMPFKQKQNKTNQKTEKEMDKNSRNL